MGRGTGVIDTRSILYGETGPRSGAPVAMASRDDWRYSVDPGLWYEQVFLDYGWSNKDWLGTGDWLASCKSIPSLAWLTKDWMTDFPNVGGSNHQTQVQGLLEKIDDGSLLASTSPCSLDLLEEGVSELYGPVLSVSNGEETLSAYASSLLAVEKIAEHEIAEHGEWMVGHSRCPWLVYVVDGEVLGAVYLLQG